MGIVAAFLWDSQFKSISYMIVDRSNKNKIMAGPKKVSLQKFSAETLKEEAVKTIKDFFNEMGRDSGLDNEKIKIEYKIVGHAATTFPTSINKMPCRESKIVYDKFMKEVNLNGENFSLAKQWKSKLTGEPLNAFRAGLIQLGYFKPEKGNAYVHHLWALIVHATTKTYRRCLKQLEKADDQRPVGARLRNR